MSEISVSETAELFRAGLDRLAADDLPGCLELFSEDIEYEFPFAPAGRPQSVRGRENLRQYLEPIFARAGYDGISDLIVYETDVNETIVAEMTIALKMHEGDRAFSLRYIVVVHAADGRITSYRDYWNPLGMSDQAAAGAA